MSKHQDYALFHKFIETFLPDGFTNIDSNHPLMVDLELLMEKYNQFIYVGDLVHLKVLFTSKRSTQMIGVEPKDVNPYLFMNHTHPDDLVRFNNARAKLIKMGQELFVSQEKFAILTTTIKMKNAAGDYSNFLNQVYFFYSSDHNTVFFLKLHTNVDGFKKIKNGYYYYTGKDLSHFKYPNRQLLNAGGAFTKRELEIIKLIVTGMSTQQIAKKLFLSPYTINTHRVNILKKSGKTTFFEIISELVEDGIL